MHNQITDTLIAITFLKSLVVKKQSFEDAATIRDYEVGYINKLKKEDKYFIDKEGSSKAIDYT